MTAIGEISSKDDLHGHLLLLREAAIYDIFGQVCLHEFIKRWAAGKEDPTTLTTELPEGTISLREFIDRLNDHGGYAARETKRNANRSTTRNLLKEGFRIAQSYYQDAGEAATLTGQSWYQFARILVNSLSHDFRLNFRQHDLNQMPVSHGGHTIEASMNGQSLSMPIGILLSLYDELFAFVESDLK